MLLWPLALTLSVVHIPLWSQEEIDLEDVGGPSSDSAAKSGSSSAGDSFSDSDFDQEINIEGSMAEPSLESQPDEMGLEPLKGDENQVTKTPEPKDELPKESTPQEMTLQKPQEGEKAEPPPPVFVEPSPPNMADEPDLAYENRLYDIYQNYNSKRMTDAEWQQLIGERESEAYRIQPGDTLWSISKTFFNDGNYWPKIWQLNAKITNPHLIKPGNSIRFLLGTESDTPAFAVTENEEVPPEAPPMAEEKIEPPPSKSSTTVVGKATTDVNGAPTDEVEIPPPTQDYPPLLSRIPPSLPEIRQKHEDVPYDDAGISIQRRPIADLQETKVLESFVDEEDLSEAGEVKEIEGGAATAAQFQYVFVSLKAGESKPGDHFTVIRRTSKIKRANDEVEADDLGYQYHVQGELKLEDLLSTTTGRKAQDIFRAMVVRSMTQIEKGTFVVPGAMPKISLAAEGEKASVITQIIGADFVANQKTLTLHSLAYLSAGSDKGLKEGQILTVRANTRLRNPDSIISESYIPVGKLKIAKVSKNFATAIVLRVWDAILVGDVTGDGKVIPPEPVKKGSGGRLSKATAAETEDNSELDSGSDAPMSDEDLELDQ